MATPASEQLTLIDGYYRCQHCARDVARVQKSRRFWICDACWQDIVVPTALGEAITDYDSDVRVARSRYWQWYQEMEDRFPVEHNWQPKKKFEQPKIDAFWPLCRSCGAETAEYEFSTARSLFGRHRAAYCPTCLAKNGVESVFRMARGGVVHADWDDEDWLDLLCKSDQEAFELGVLPDYWFELRNS